MIVFCYGISLDVRDQRFAALDLDQTPESRAYIAAYEGSHCFAAVAEPRSAPEAERLLAEGAASVTIEIPPGFGRALRSVGRPEVLVVVDGALPFRGETLEGYAADIHAGYLQDLARDAGRSARNSPGSRPATATTRASRA